jgi:hypothetical protein
MKDTEKQFIKLDITMLKISIATMFILGPTLYLNGCQQHDATNNKLHDITNRLRALEQRK